MSGRKSAHSGWKAWDIEVDPETSRRLSRVKQRNTRPERVVRSILSALGHRFRTKNRDLPGRPDIANRSRRWAIFVHGCFWHHHEGCSAATVPKTNRAFWQEKFRANITRDRRAVAALEEEGFLTIVVWECETVDLERLTGKLARGLASRLPR